jgi:aminotransferase
VFELKIGSTAAPEKTKPDIRKITRLVPRDGNLVQGQSELAIDPALAAAASEMISASLNHYSPAEGVEELRKAVAQKIARFNGVDVDPQAQPLEVLITPGATGALVAIARTYLAGGSALVFEPYYPYHRRIPDELGGRTEVVPLHGPNLELDADELRVLCSQLKDRQSFPLRAIVACSPANPTGKIFTKAELETIATVCRDYDLLCIADEVYEHYVLKDRDHLSIAAFEGMRERTITVNSFSKSWNISGWRLGYVYGDGKLVGKLNNVNNVFYVCSPTPLQRALSVVLTSELHYYSGLQDRFATKRAFAAEALESVGFELYDSGSAFYVWARIPPNYQNATQLNELLIANGVAGVPGSAFADSDLYDQFMRFCIAREDDVLESALDRIKRTLAHG